MGWRLTESVEEYAAAAGDVLARRAAENTISLTVIENARLREVPGARYAWWEDPAGAVQGAASLTPPYPLLLSDVPAAALGELVALTRRAGWPVTGVSGSPATAAAFAAAWCSGGRWRTRVDLVLHRLTRLTPPDPAPAGRPRPATAADLRTVIRLWTEFGRETATQHGAGAAATAVDRTRDGLVTGWDVAGRLVSLAGRSRPAAGVVRIGPVYTPPAERGRGYGTAVTASATAAAQEAAPDVVLFTDAANPTSNAIYRRLGYVPIGARVELAWSGLSGS